jgi:hypothetical protein
VEHNESRQRYSQVTLLGHEYRVPFQYFGTAIKEREAHWPKGQVMANLFGGSHSVTGRRVGGLGPASC